MYSVRNIIIWIDCVEKNYKNKHAIINYFVFMINSTKHTYQNELERVLKWVEMENCILVIIYLL